MRAYFLLPMLVLLAGCNWFNNVTGLAKESNKAIGAACRQTGRSLEECYLRNPEADKAQVYAGWREMHEYMVKQKLDTMPPPHDVAGAGTDSSAPAAEHKPEAKTSQAEPAEQEQKMLTNEEADKAAQNDPQVEAVMRALRQRPEGAKPPGEADQKRLLNIINELNSKPGASG